jgi:hypothetical protein
MRFRIRRFTRSLLRSLPEAERSLVGGGRPGPPSLLPGKEECTYIENKEVSKCLRKS